MRRIVVLLAVVLSVMLLGSGSPKEFDDATIQGADLEGSWFCISELNDGQRPFGWLPYFETFRSGGVASCSAPYTRSFNGTYRANNSRKLAQLDEMYTYPNGYKSNEKGIYEVKGNTLRIAYRTRGERPVKFDEKGGGVILHTFFRVKEARIEALEKP